MKSFQSTPLLEELQSDIREIMLATTRLFQEDANILSQSPAAGKWSVAQVLEHLNTYARYYLPTIEAAMKNSHRPAAEQFTPGWLGDYFTKTMRPGKNGQVTNKMQAPKDHRPPVTIQSKPVMEEFLQQQQEFLKLLEEAKQHNIGKIRIPITLTKLVKLKLGDTFRFLIANEQRHFVQVKNTLEAVQRLHENVQQSVW